MSSQKLLYSNVLDSDSFCIYKRHRYQLQCECENADCKNLFIEGVVNVWNLTRLTTYSVFVIIRI